MNSLPFLVSEVLKKMEPDTSKWQQWLKKLPLFPVSDAKQMQIFVSLIEQCKQENAKIFVAGDYDCDGILATTILVDGLRRYGLEVGFYIPDRIREGYGLQARTVHMVANKGYACIITVDNGVKAHEALQEAKGLGLKVIVTDHHLIDEEVICDCLIHPDTLGYPFESECGAAIAYECVRALGQDTSYSLELAAVASIGDVMKVTDQTRAIIQQGLMQLNKDRERHLIGLARERKLNETGVAFQIVPALNAVGRLSNLANVNNVVRYFLSNQTSVIASMQNQILQLNTQRKKLSEQMVKIAKEKCEMQEDILLVCDASFHEGIIGLVAGNLCSQYNKPCIILTKNQEGFKASMRSPEGFDCMDFLSEYPNFLAIGGHSQAAGFSFGPQDFDSFRSYIRTKSKTYRWTKCEGDTLVVDACHCTIEEIETLDLLRPFGPGFACPLFEIMHPQIQSIVPIQNGKHCRYVLNTGLDCMHFNQSVTDQSRSVNSIRSFVGQLQVDQYRGRKKATFIIEEIRWM